MNTFSFLKAALYRRFNAALQDKPHLHYLFDHSMQPEAEGEIHSIEQLKATLEEKAPECLPVVESIIASFKPGLIVNRVRRTKDLLLGDNLIKLTQKYLEVNLQFLGYLVESDRVRDSVEEMIPFLIKDPQSKPSENLQQILGALTKTDLHLIKRDGMIFVSKQVRLSSSWNA
jgi:flagellar biosynthesis protein FlhG